MSTLSAKTTLRKKMLIKATLDCIAEEGLQKTTVRKIAEYAGVTNGLIRFHFSGKKEILRAAYKSLLSQMSVDLNHKTEGCNASAETRLSNFIKATLSEPIVSSKTVLIWANFLPMTFLDAEMSTVRLAEYNKTIKTLEPLIISALKSQGVLIPQQQAELQAIKLNALIDGLWLEGSMAGYKFSDGELAKIGIESASAILGCRLAL